MGKQILIINDPESTVITPEGYQTATYVYSIPQLSTALNGGENITHISSVASDHTCFATIIFAPGFADYPTQIPNH